MRERGAQPPLAEALPTKVGMHADAERADVAQRVSPVRKHVAPADHALRGDGDLPRGAGFDRVLDELLHPGPRQRLDLRQKAPLTGNRVQAVAET
jgi:hypothetical protein